jgi:hypothetical protein
LLARKYCWLSVSFWRGVVGDCVGVRGVTSAAEGAIRGSFHSRR